MGGAPMTPVEKIPVVDLGGSDRYKIDYSDDFR